ncbi:MAG: Ig-like domain-containing protein [Vicinamibacterales bacterium]
MTARLRHFVRASAAAVLVLASAGTAAAQLNEHCTVSVLNRTVRVNPDGSWLLPNVPAATGQVKARATCVENGITRSGESDFFTITPNRMNAIPPIRFGATSQVPSSLAVTPANPVLTSPGEALQLTATATYPGNSTRDVTPASAGTNYTTSNAAIASVTADGLVTAVTSGTVVVQATNDGTPAMAIVRVVLSTGDTDGDGMPDEYELAHGFNPNVAIDALEDPDRDGLTNLQEFQIGTDPRLADTDADGLTDGQEGVRGTHPLLWDTDGDGISDGVEVTTGTDPVDAGSFNFAAALSSIAVTPGAFNLTFNTIMGEASVQLTAAGTMLDGRSIELTNRGVNFESSNQDVCNFGVTAGQVFAGESGPCTITATFAGFVATALGQVRTFSPTALGWIDIPGYANNVDVNGNFAFVAAGASGLVVVAVSNPAVPEIVATLDTPGNANDVRVVGNLAYVADGPAGLRIIDVTDPMSPAMVGSVDTPGDASDVVVSGNLAFVADGISGLQIINVSDPAAPALVRSVATVGTARGVDVNGQVAVVVTDGNEAALLTVDITNIATAAIVGSVAVGGQPTDVSLAPGFAYVAAFTDGMSVVDVRNPAAPAVVGGIHDLFVPRDVQVAGPFAIFAEQLFANAVAPIVDITEPDNPRFRAVLDFGQDYAGTGIALSGPFVYWTGQTYYVGEENGTSGDTRLFIGQYLAREDNAGVPPTVMLTAPADGATLVEGESLTVRATAADDVAVAQVAFSVNGQETFVDTSEPYEYTFVVAPGQPVLVLGATAMDLGGNTATADDVTVSVIPDPLTTVIGRVLDQAGQPVVGADVRVLGHATVTGSDGRFTMAGVPTVQPLMTVRASLTQGATVLTGFSAATPPVRGGTTDVGDIVARDTTFEIELGTRLPPCDWCGTMVPLPFAFPIGGSTYTEIYLNPGAAYTSGNDQFQVLCCEISTNPDDPASGVYVNDQLPGRVVVTWYRQLSGGGGNPEAAALVNANAAATAAGNTAQLILFEDGRVQYGYRGVDPALRAQVGLFPSTTVNERIVDFSATPQQSLAPGEAVYEYFNGIGGSPLFDLDGGFLTFAPSAGGGYELRTVPDSVSPICAIASPADGATVFEGEVLQIEATASDNGSVSRVRFQSNVGVLDQVDDTEPFGATFTVPVGVAQATLTATAFDGWGNTGACMVTVAVVPGPPPASSITLPAADAVLTAGATVAVSVDAANRVPVSRIDLVANGETIASDTAAPFTFLFTVPSGVSALALSTLATDTVGKTGAADIVNVMVAADPLTTVQGLVVDRADAPIEAAAATLATRGVSAEVFNFSSPLTTMPDLSGRTPDQTRIMSALSARNPNSVFGTDPYGYGAAASHAIRFSANLQGTVAGTYTFTLGVNRGGRLLVNGLTVVDLPTGTGQFQQASGTVALPGGTVPVQILAFDNGNPEVQLSFALEDADAQVVPMDVLTPAIAPYQATTGADGAFSVAGVRTVLGSISASAQKVDATGRTLTGRSAAVAPVPGGTTDVGRIRLSSGRVLVLADVDTPGTQALVAALVGAGHVVTLRPPPEYTWDGTNPPLTDFNVVIHLNGATYETPLPSAAQTALVDFVRAGGGFIGSQWNGYERGQGGRQFEMADLILQLWGGDQVAENCGSCAVTYTPVPGTEAHPVLEGISAFTFFADGHDAGPQVPFETSPSVVLMRVNAGGAAVLVRDLDQGRVVNFSHAANYGSGVTLQDPNIQRLYINAVAWIAGHTGQ